MTTFLYSCLLTAGSDKMMQTDPHGWTLTAISVCVVFAALIVLYFLYSISGKIFSARQKREVPEAGRGKDADEETAAAIALALSLYEAENLHDEQSGILTIRRSVSPWADKSLTFRKSPR